MKPNRGIANLAPQLNLDGIFKYASIVNATLKSLTLLYDAPHGALGPHGQVWKSGGSFNF